MTPGQEALIEAMRVEQARIYSQTCPEHRADRDVALDARIGDLHQAGQSVASIALRLGMTKAGVTAVIERLEGAA